MRLIISSVLILSTSSSMVACFGERNHSNENTSANLTLRLDTIVRLSVAKEWWINRLTSASSHMDLSSRVVILFYRASSSMWLAQLCLICTRVVTFCGKKSAESANSFKKKAGSRIGSCYTLRMLAASDLVCSFVRCFAEHSRLIGEKTGKRS